MTAEINRHKGNGAVKEELAALTLDKLEERVAATKDKDVELIDVNGQITQGINRGFLSYDNGTTIISHSVMLDLFIEQGEAHATIPPQRISGLNLTGAKVIELHPRQA